MNSGKKRTWWLFLAVALVSLDQSLKYLIRSSGGFYICNPGIALGIDLPLWAVGMLLFILVLIFILSINNFQFTFFNFYSILNNLISNFKIGEFISGFKLKNLSGNNLAGLTLILAGGFSNIVDRFIFGCVVDFIDMGVFWGERFLFFPVFNLADILIFFGVLILIWQTLIQKDKKVL